MRQRFAIASKPETCMLSNFLTSAYETLDALVDDGCEEEWASFSETQTGFRLDLEAWGRRLGCSLVGFWLCLALWGDSAPITRYDSLCSAIINRSPHIILFENLYSMYVLCVSVNLRCDRMSPGPFQLFRGCFRAGLGGREARPTTSVITVPRSRYLLTFCILNGEHRERMHIWACSKQLLRRCGCKGRCTIDPIFKMCAWSLKALMIGKWPMTDHNNRPFPPGSWRAKRAGGYPHNFGMDLPTLWISFLFGPVLKVCRC